MLSPKTVLANGIGGVQCASEDDPAVTEYVGRFEFVQMNYGFLKDVRISRGNGPRIGDVFMHKSALKTDRCLCTEQIEELDGCVLAFKVRASTSHIGKLEAFDVRIKRRRPVFDYPLE